MRRANGGRGAVIGIIGGTGLYGMDSFEERESHAVATPFGDPSAPVRIGLLGGTRVAFLARHGEHHEFLPSEINFRANVWALKSLGVRTVIGVSAVGSLREEVQPGDLALPVQYLDATRGLRAASFFGGGLVAHVSTAEPTCRATADCIARVARGFGWTLHTDLTYACVEGPRLGTRAESRMLRGAGADLVGMTNVPEAFLAREAQLGYCTVALVTDYDCWMDDPARHASVGDVLALYRANLGRVQQLLAAVVQQPMEGDSRPCRSALRGALVTPRERLTPAQREILAVLES
jgi:5'-methylthioadenosine phosphorylase